MDCAIVSCFSNTLKDILIAGFQNRIEGSGFYHSPQIQGFFSLEAPLLEKKKTVYFKRYSRSVGWPSVQWDVVTIAMETCNSILAGYGLFS